MKKSGSIQNLFTFLMTLLICVVALPVLFSAIFIMNRIIYENSKKILKIELETLIDRAEKRYEKLKRFGLEDSEYHLKEIKEITLEEFKNYRFEKTGRVFVITNEGKCLVREKNCNTSILKKLKKSKEALIEFDFSGKTDLIYYRFYPRWDAYIGIYVDKDEIFHSKYLFLRSTIIPFILGLCLASLIILLLRKRIIQPVITLTEYAKEIKNGNLSAKIKGEFHHEFRELKDSISIMVHSLKEQIELIRNRESLLNEEKEKLLTTLKSIGEGVIVADKNGKITLMNSIAENLIGYDFVEGFYEPLEKIFVVETSKESTSSIFKRVITEKKVIYLEKDVFLVKRNGEKINIALTASPVIDIKEGTLFGAVIGFKDITEKLKMEKEILKVKKLETIGVLAGGIAHDFNNILAGILGNVELAKIYAEGKSDKLMEKLIHIEKATVRAKELAFQLLTFSKGGDPVKKPTSLKEVIIDSAEFVLRGTKIKLEWEIPDDLWWVNADAGQISQVIQNIVLNSREAIDKEGIVKIECRNLKDYRVIPYEKISNWVEIKISDTGKGIKKEIIERIFDPFFTTKEKGSGLGLTICHSIISKHGGHIEIESAPGKGTEVRIYLPALGEEFKKEIKIEERKDTKPIKQPLKGVKILVIDDEEEIREVLEEFLSFLGCMVKTAESGEKALKFYENEKFDVVITDLTIPGGMSGERIAEEILKIDPEAKIIVASGYSDDPVMANPERYGFCGVLKKPVKLKDLQKEIERVIKSENEDSPHC